VLTVTGEYNREMETYAFIDVQNTEGSADFLGFVIDWKKMQSYLNDMYKCNKTFYYPGIEIDDQERLAEFESLKSDTCIVTTKMFRKYKKKDKVFKVTCPDCKKKITKRISGGYDWKCNCDVDLTIDALESIKEKLPVKVLIFTGDGDFKPLLEKIMESNQEAKIYLFSTPVFVDKRSRLAKKLREMIALYPHRIIFIDLNDLKIRLEKELIIAQEI
jgi:uncharacterized LabA/DUF88 family protein